MRPVGAGGIELPARRPPVACVKETSPELTVSSTRTSGARGSSAIRIPWK